MMMGADRLLGFFPATLVTGALALGQLGCGGPVSSAALEEGAALTSTSLRQAASDITWRKVDLSLGEGEQVSCVWDDGTLWVIRRETPGGCGTGGDRGGSLTHCGLAALRCLMLFGNQQGATWDDGEGPAPIRKVVWLEMHEGGACGVCYPLDHGTWPHHMVPITTDDPDGLVDAAGSLPLILDDLWEGITLRTATVAPDNPAPATSPAHDDVPGPSSPDVAPAAQPPRDSGDGTPTTPVGPSSAAAGTAGTAQVQPQRTWIVDAAAWDEEVTIIDEAAWDERVWVEDVPAWDDETWVEDTPAWSEDVWVQDTPAWGEDVLVGERIVCSDGAVFWDYPSADAHLEESYLAGNYISYRVENVYETVWHEATGHWETVRHEATGHTTTTHHDAQGHWEQVHHAQRSHTEVRHHPEVGHWE